MKQQEIGVLEVVTSQDVCFGYQTNDGENEALDAGEDEACVNEKLGERGDSIAYASEFFLIDGIILNVFLTKFCVIICSEKLGIELLVFTFVQKGCQSRTIIENYQLAVK